MIVENFMVFKRLLKNRWVVGIGTTVIAGLIIYFLGIDREKATMKNSITNTGSNSINTVGQSGGTNIINISARAFRGDQGNFFYLVDGRYEIDINLFPTSNENATLGVDIEIEPDERISIESIELTSNSRIIKGNIITKNEKNGWLIFFSDVSPINQELKIIFSEKPKLIRNIGIGS